jgi:hypothetical protein
MEVVGNVHVAQTTKSRTSASVLLQFLSHPFSQFFNTTSNYAVSRRNGGDIQYGKSIAEPTVQEPRTREG